VFGYDLDGASVDRFVALGGIAASSAREVAEKADIVIVSLPNSTVNESVFLGEAGLLEAARPGLLVIDMGSSVPSSTRMLAERLAEKGARMLDAPVSGGPQGAEAGTLAIIVGGDQADIQQAMPLFHVLGAPEKITIAGPLGSGHMIKAINNYVYASCIWACSEAFVVAAKAGLDANVVQKVISTSTARNNVVEDNIPNEVLNRTFPVWFSLGLLTKDVNTFLALARELNVPLPIGALLREIYNLGVTEVGAGAGDSSIITMLEKWAGVVVEG
jgi:3-hydroxyisobutyrate dehydrogenase